MEHSYCFDLVDVERRSIKMVHFEKGSKVSRDLVCLCDSCHMFLVDHSDEQKSKSFASQWPVNLRLCVVTTSGKLSKEIEISTYTMERLHEMFDVIKHFMESFQMYHQSNKNLILMQLKIVLKSSLLLITILVESQQLTGIPK